MSRRNGGCDNSHQLQLCSDCTSSCSVLSALCLGCYDVEEISQYQSPSLAWSPPPEDVTVAVRGF